MLFDVRGNVVKVGNTVSIAERIQNIAQHVVAVVGEISDDEMEIRVRYPDGKVSPWRRIYYHNIPQQKYNKLLRIEP